MSEKPGVTILWRIENFFHCDQDDDEAVQSKVFYIHTLGESKWYLGIYPNLEKIKVFLHNVSYNDSNRLVIDYDFAFLSEDGSVLWTSDAKNVEIQTQTSYEVAAYQTSQDIFVSRVEEYLPQDTLTVRCRIWESKKSLTYPILYHAFTRIEIKRTIFHWAVKEFSNMRVNGGKKVHIINVGEEQAKFCYGLSLSGADSDEENVSIVMRLLNSSILKLFSTCKISVLNAMGRVVKETVRQCFVFLPEDRVWYFSEFLTKDELTRENYECLEDDELNLLFNVTETTGENYSNIECVTSLPLWIQPPLAYDVSVCKHFQHTAHNNNQGETLSILQNDFLTLYKDRSLSDFELRSESASFPVHKSVLAARSPVFKALFLSSMREGEDNFMEIPDIDSDTLEKLLEFIYSGNVENMDWLTASKLYYATDKYEVFSLKQKCTALLSDSISGSNVCEILLLADRHSDSALKSSIHDFLLHNGGKIIRSKEWTQFLESNPLLAAKTMQLIYLRKLDMLAKKRAHKLPESSNEDSELKSA